MSWFLLYLIALSYIIHNANAIDIDQRIEIIEMVERQNTRLAVLEEMVGKLWKENRELKTNVFSLNRFVQEQQSRILELEEDSEASEDKIKDFDGQRSSDKDLTSKTNNSNITILKKRNTTRNAKQNAEKIRETRIIEGNVNPTIQPTTVAFYAYMSSQHIVNPHYTLIFDHIETNIGGGYSKDAGAFTVPIKGVYMLTYTTFPYGSSTYASIELAVNSVARGSIFVDSSSDSNVAGCTGNVVLSLNQGDVCIVRSHPNFPSTGRIESDEYMRSSFSGMLISQ